MSFLFSSSWESAGIVLERHISVSAAAEYSGYSLQYLRRLLRSGRLKGTKVGQIWLIDLDAFARYLDGALTAEDDRFGPQSSTVHHVMEVAR
jgi:excisionase family DNA binding protein